MMVYHDFRISAELSGRMFENYVPSELIKVGKTVMYWQTKGKADVDFVVKEGQCNTHRGQAKETRAPRPASNHKTVLPRLLIHIPNIRFRQSGW
jgi:predicted AAA+ superfamily ATPase